LSGNSNIELLKWMLEDVRKVTLNGVEHLTEDQLFIPPVEGEYPIGAYLMHLAECEIYWLEVLSGIEQSEELKKEAYYDTWFDAFKTPSPPLTPPSKDDYHKVLKKSRSNFIDYISGMKDDELDEFVIRKSRDKEVKISKKWIIYHIIEHEAHHRGQMQMLIRKAGWNRK